jgi:ribosome-binding factor A
VVANTGSHRVQKMASLIRSEIARLLVAEVADPRLQHLVITEVELSKDLRHARVFYEAGQSSDQKEILRGLSRAGAFFRKKIGTNLDLKYVPELSFQADVHSSNLNRVLSALEQVKKADSGENNE